MLARVITLRLWCEGCDVRVRRDRKVVIGRGIGGCGIGRKLDGVQVRLRAVSECTEGAKANVARRVAFMLEGGGFDPILEAFF